MSLAGDYDDEVVTFYRKYVGAVRGYLINIGTDHGLADEIVDDAFLAARRRWARVRDLERPEAYVFKVARNERSKRHKSQCGREEPRPGPEPAWHRSGVDSALAVLDRMVLRQVLPLLPPRVREVIVLRHIRDFTVAETAELMGISPGAVKRYTSDGLKRLRLLLADDPDIREGENR